ncbi:uncharacterized protein [Haliotis cracherodii]|uniref:uncharacterized protein n=1 Tax=Haliotis cracherodii TaxID=6455 RepID=UPI0039E7E754
MLRERKYSLLHLDDTFGVAYSSRECPLGQFSCHHVDAALWLQEASKTDVKCSWLNAPKSKMRPGIASMEELFPPRKPNYKALTREVIDDDRKFMHDELDKLGQFTALRWILSPEPPVEGPIITSVEDGVLSQAYMEAPCKQSWLSRAVLLSPSRIADIAKKTAGQRTNPLWCIVRKHQISASNFGAVFGSIGRNRIWMHESGVLGASPDGLVKAAFMMPVMFQSPAARHFLPDNIEVKCPYAARTVGIQAAVDTVKGFCLG